MLKEKMTCIICPLSCQIEVTLDDNSKILDIKGNRCKRGENYIRSELTNPVRMLTSTVKLSGGLYRRLPVSTSSNIPKEKLFDVMKEINKIEVCTPVHVGDIIINNVCGLKIDILASRSAERINGENESKSDIRLMHID